MSLLFIDGFDHYTTADMGLKWSDLGAISWTIAAGAGRRGGGAAKMEHQYYPLGKNLAANTATLVVGCAICSGGSPAGAMLTLRDAAGIQASVVANTDGSISIYRGSATALLGTSAPGILLAGVYQYIEFKVTIGASSGAASVRVNNIAVLNLTAQNTQGSATNAISAFYITPAGSSGNSYVDDLYVCDGAGTVNNDFLGDMRVDTLYPTADGTYSNMICSTGTAHWALVDDTTPNTTDYVSSSVAGDKDSYVFSDLPAGTAAVAGVQITHYSQKTDAGARSAACLTRSGTTNAQGASKALGTSYQYFPAIVELDPATALAWTQAAVNAAEFGVVVA